MQKDGIKKLIKEHNRRLQLLKQKQAQQGLETPVSVLTEIEDIEVEIGKLQVELDHLNKSTTADSLDRRTEPDLELIIGAAYSNGIVPLPAETGKLQGQDNIHAGYVRPPVSRVVFGLFLENKSPNAAQFVRITLRLKDTQRPLRFEAFEGSFQYYKPRINTVQQETVFLQFGEDLVVYKGDGVLLGAVYLEWEKEARPDKLVLDAGLYNLVGETKSVTVSRSIEWNCFKCLHMAQSSSARNSD